MRYLSHSLAVGAFVVAFVGTCATNLRGAITYTGDTTVGSLITVGQNAAGTYRVDGGSATSANNLTVGATSSGNGTATITGSGSRLTASVSVIGSSGTGKLEIFDGAVVVGGTMNIGVSNSAKGTVIVDGEGSLLNLTNQLLISNGSTQRLLRISNGGVVSVGSTSSTLSDSANIELDDGLLRMTSFDNYGTVSGSGEVMLASQNFSGFNQGSIKAYEGDLLRFTGRPSFSNNGSIAAEGGEISFVPNVSNGFLSTVSLNNGIVRFGTGHSQETNFSNTGIVISTGGDNELFGRVSNDGDGQIAVANNSVLLFHEHVEATGGTLSVHAGSKAVFLDDLSMHAGSALVTDIASTNPETGIGQIEVAGEAQLIGTLNANLTSFFTPKNGDSFTLMSAGTINGSLTLGIMPTLATGLMWDLDVISNQLLLSVIPGLAGDYNRNGVVDIADYVLWRKSFGQTGQDLDADGDSNGVVNNNDYTFWRARYGDALPVTPGFTAVPEPTAAGLYFVALGLVLCGMRSRINAHS